MKIMVKVVLSVVMVGILVLPVLSDSWYNRRLPGDQEYTVALDYDGPVNVDDQIKTYIGPHDVAGQFHCGSWLDDGQFEYFEHIVFENGDHYWFEDCDFSIDGFIWHQDVDTPGTHPTSAYVDFGLVFPY